ncbi:MAG: DUF378 domain-containing protein [Thermoleophilia bacterium]
MHFFGWLALLLVIVGAFNWLLIGIFEYDLVATLFGNMSAATRAIYTVVGAGGVYLLGLTGLRAFVPGRGMKHTEIGQH